MPDVVMIENAPGGDGTSWRKGITYPASDSYARYLVEAGKAYYADGAGGGVPRMSLQVGASRNLAATDDGRVLECTATVTLTVPTGLPPDFGCVIIPNGTTSIASAGGTLLNGATSTLTRAAASNALVPIVSRPSAADSYVVGGS